MGAEAGHVGQGALVGGGSGGAVTRPVGLSPLLGEAVPL